MKNHQTIIGALVATASWALGYGATQILGVGLSAVSAYAVLVGWWFTAYISSQFDLPVKSAIPLGVVFFLVFLLSSINQKNWFYADVFFLSSSSILALGLVQTAIFISPIIFNWVFEKTLQRIFDYLQSLTK